MTGVSYRVVIQRSRSTAVQTRPKRARSAVRCNRLLAYPTGL